MVNRIKTHISGLDAHMSGGIPEGHVVLVSGIAGTMKSSFCFNILYCEAIKGKNSVFFTLEQSAASFIEHLKNLNLNLDKINLVVVTDLLEIGKNLKKSGKKGTVYLVDIGLMRKVFKINSDGYQDANVNWLIVIKNVMKQFRDLRCLFFVMDSLSAFYLLANFKNPRTEMFYFFGFLRELEMTSFLISEMPLSKDRYSPYDIEDFLADGVIKFDLVEKNRKVARTINVIKMRTAKVSLDIFKLEYRHNKFIARR